MDDIPWTDQDEFKDDYYSQAVSVSLGYLLLLVFFPAIISVHRLVMGQWGSALFLLLLYIGFMTLAAHVDSTYVWGMVLIYGYELFTLKSRVHRYNQELGEKLLLKHGVDDEVWWAMDEVPNNTTQNDDPCSPDYQYPKIINLERRIWQTLKETVFNRRV